MDEITSSYLEIRKAPAFLAGLAPLYKHFVGRPSPVFHAKNLSAKHGADSFVKREDVNLTGTQARTDGSVLGCQWPELSW